MSPTLSRRGALRAGGFASLLAAAMAAGGGAAVAEPLGGYPDLPPWADAVLDRLLAESTDAMRGVVVMMMPAGDPYSVQQGVTATGPGPLDQRSPEAFGALIDRFVPHADQLLRPVAVALMATAADVGDPAARAAGGLPDPAVTAAVDRALGYRFTDSTFPASLLAAILLDVTAVLLDPRTVAGPFASAFANARYETKCRVFEALESPLPELISIVDEALPQPLTGSASGVLRFFGGILLDGSAFTAWSEHDLWDRRTRVLSARPVAWDIADYRPNGPVDGHSEFLGFHRGIDSF
ncbi:hypothetical protein [Rhodococcoides corynebacterioides]|uniref:Secreted protein n=1 Tax=Rhodococcoides corynebacterioides TaxID=53972 RepID=A0ABS7P1Y8_9NOCA|nr:hypothetical protein [Rhodococcus corynebacterioides]MBY6348957.1 hypothetical protein [Rhodococcus corynebacterioides]MBY6365226.1 hypothetical protein [Rhodococcus corynebacterioides]MBY6406638.1 hypothetical protein [Rhodococcus corynebacterioides]